MMLELPLFHPTRPPKGAVLAPFPETATVAKLPEMLPELTPTRPPAYPLPLAVTVPDAEALLMLLPVLFWPTRPPIRKDPAMAPETETLEMLPSLNPVRPPT
jgi:hypothetical protein